MEKVKRPALSLRPHRVADPAKQTSSRRTPGVRPTLQQARAALAGLAELLGTDREHTARAAPNALPRDASPDWARETVPGTLWAKDSRGSDLPPSIEDIHQAHVGDCFLFAAMVAVVTTDPARIQQMFHNNGDGTYTVTFKGIGLFRADREIVTPEFIKGKHADVGPRHALWPLFIEKAYEQTRGGLAKVDQGGNGGAAIDDLIAEGPSRFDPRAKDPRWVIGKLAYAHIKRYPTVALTPGETEFLRRGLRNGDPIVAHHTYAVVDVHAAKGDIQLFNPWGHDQPNGDGWVSIRLFQTAFWEVDINQ